MELKMCIVCKHNQIKDIDRALLTGATLTSLSQTYGFSPSALHRHQEHLTQKMARAQKRFHDGLRQGLFCKLNIVMELVLSVVRGARAGEDFKLFLQASREFTRIISLMNKMEVHLEPEMIYCLMASPQWDLQDNLLPNAFQALTETRQTLKVNLFATCPEPEPEPIPAPAQSSPLQIHHPKFATPDPTDALAYPRPEPGPNPQLKPGPATRHAHNYRKPQTADCQPPEKEARNSARKKALPKILTNNLNKLSLAKKVFEKFANHLRTASARTSCRGYQCAIKWCLGFPACAIPEVIPLILYRLPEVLSFIPLPRLRGEGKGEG